MRILSWNVHGSCSVYKWRELFAILNYWQSQQNPVDIICLQELSVQRCTIVAPLTAMGYRCYIQREGYGNRGSNQLIAVWGNVNVLASGIINLPLNPTEQAYHLRLPMYVDFIENGLRVAIVTYHAPLFLYTSSMVYRLNAWINSQIDNNNYAAIYLAGDLNLKNPPLTGNYMRISHSWDHIVAWNRNIANGIHSAWSYSDHLPISADH